jgi:hypothetical protein
MLIITVNSNTCITNANFSLSPSGTPLYWNVIPAAPSNISNAIWSWSDGSTNYTLYTSHTYSAAGTYSICLSVTVNCGVSTSTCSYYSIYRPSVPAHDMSMAHLNVIEAATVGIKNTESENDHYSISPNPNNGSFNLSMKGANDGRVNISVYNVVGNLVYQADAETKNGALVKDIQVNQPANGVYFIKVISDHQSFTKKVRIQNP